MQRNPVSKKNDRQTKKCAYIKRSDSSASSSKMEIPTDWTTGKERENLSCSVDPQDSCLSLGLAGLARLAKKPRDLPVSASAVLGAQVYTPMPDFIIGF